MLGARADLGDVGEKAKRNMTPEPQRQSRAQQDAKVQPIGLGTEYVKSFSLHAQNSELYPEGQTASQILEMGNKKLSKTHLPDTDLSPGRFYLDFEALTIRLTCKGRKDE